MTDDTILKLGKLIADPATGRDAIHIAVAPMVAAETLAPGQHVGLIGEAAGRAGDPVGIVDPFLREAVPQGARFFLYLYPATITSLRHEWTHPAFAAQVEKGLNGGGEYAPSDSKDESEKWLRAFIASSDCPGYDDVMAAISGAGLAAIEEYGSSWGRYDGEALFFLGRDAHSAIPMEFWHHAEIVLGRKLPYHPAYFSCSC